MLPAILVVMAMVAVALGWLGYLGGPYATRVPGAAADGGRPETVAVLLSGDMGVRVGMAPAITRRLAADGIPVLEVNSLNLFRRQRSPAQIQAIIADLSREALDFSGAKRLILIGQSFGADMLQVGATGLPAPLRARVGLIALVVPGATVQLRASPSEIFTFAASSYPAAPTARQLIWVPVVCIHGAREKGSLCPHLTMPNVRRVALPGGHLLNRDADRLYATLAAAMAAAGND